MASQSQKKICTAAAVKKIQAKATSAQIDYMVDYFVENPDVATGKFKTLHGKSDLSALWEKLTEELNNMWNDGRSKDVKSWKSTWRDNKTLVSQKVAKIRANRAATGNVGGPPAKLTEREQKILGLMGFDYVEGVESPDSFPEEQANANELLAEGNEDILDIGADSLTVRSTSDFSGVTYADFEMLDEVLEGVDDAEFSSIKEYTVTRQISPLAALEDEATTSSKSCLSSRVQKLPCTVSWTQSAASSKLGQSSNQEQGSSRPERAPKIKKQSRVRLVTQLQEAREDFGNLAERQISCMKIFATAMKQIAENDKEKNEIFRAFVENQKNRDEAFSELAIIIKDCVNVLKKN